MIRRPPISTLFPYPTLSRSHVHPPRRPGDAGPAGRPLPAGPAHGDHVPRPGPADPARAARGGRAVPAVHGGDRKSTRLNSSHSQISYAVFCLKKKNNLKPYSLNRLVDELDLPARPRPVALVRQLADLCISNSLAQPALLHVA